MPVPGVPPSVGAGVGAAATVVFGAVEATDDQGRFRDPDSSAVYTDYQITNNFYYDRHVYQMGLTSPNGFSTPPIASNPTGGGVITSTGILPTCAFVQLAAPTLLWVADWTACRAVKKPLIPYPNPPAGSLWVLLENHIAPAAITLNDDGATFLYRISGTYVYGHVAPDTINYGQLVFPSPPWIYNVTAAEVGFDGSEFIYGIIDPFHPFGNAPKVF